MPVLVSMSSKMINKKVGIARCPSYESEEVYKALKRSVELAGYPDLAKKTVLLKPNILSDSVPEKAVTTNPVFLEAAIRLVKEAGARRILVGDSPGLQTPGFSGKACGLFDAATRNGAEWVDFTKEKTEISCTDGKMMKKFTVAKAAREADFIISLPKLKTHQLMYFTGAIKNIFGFIPSLAKSPLHVRFPARESFASMLVDLCLAVKPDYAFMDAITGMEGPGPGSGTPRHIGLVLASSNLLAIDVAASTIIGYPPLEIPVNKDAISRGYWLSDFNEIEYPGLSPADLKITDYKKIPIKRTKSQLIEFLLPLSLRRLKDALGPGPEINHDSCVRCGDCLKICGSSAISREHGKEGRLVIDYRSCIRCYCCHEVCPKKAIDIAKRPRNRQKR